MFKLDKIQQINFWVLGVVAFVVFPLFTAIFLSQENPIMHSITEMGFDLGYYVPFLVWGIFIIAYIIYSLLMILKYSDYRKEVKIVLLAILAVVDILFILTGACSDNPEKVSDTIIQIHNKSAIAMFVGHFVLVGVMTIFSFFRNRTQGFVNLTFIGFFLITLVYCYASVTLSETFSVGQGATALAEGYAFCLIMIYMFIYFVGTLVFPPNENNPLVRITDKNSIL